MSLKRCRKVEGSKGAEQQTRMCVWVHPRQQSKGGKLQAKRPRKRPILCPKLPLLANAPNPKRKFAPKLKRARGRRHKQNQNVKLEESKRGSNHPHPHPITSQQSLLWRLNLNLHLPTRKRCWARQITPKAIITTAEIRKKTPKIKIGPSRVKSRSRALRAKRWRENSDRHSKKIRLKKD